MSWIKKVPALLWIALLIWATRRIEWASFRQALAQVPWTAAIGVLLACWLATGFQALRFYFLYPGGLSALRHVGLNFALQAGNILLPMRSGELLRPFYMKRWNRTLALKELMGWSIADKLAEVIAILPLVLAACVVFADDPRFELLSRWAWPAAASILFIGVPLLVIKGRREFTRQVPLSILCSFVGWLLNLAIFYFMVPDLRLALALLVVVNLAAAIPALPAGFGAFEAAFVWLGRMAGLPGEHALALALVAHVMQIIGTLSVGLPVLSAWGWPESVAIENML